MNYDEMTDLLDSLDGPVYGPIAERISNAGAQAFEWVFRSREFYNLGWTQTQYRMVGYWSMLAACELQLIVEQHNGFDVGKLILRGNGA